MEEPQSKIEKLTDDIKEYVNIRYELMALKAGDKVSVIGSQAIAWFVIGFVALLFIVFISFALAYYLSSQTGIPYSGFFIVAGIYLLLGIISLLFKGKLIIKPLRNKIIEELFDED